MKGEIKVESRKGLKTYRSVRSKKLCISRVYLVFSICTAISDSIVQLNYPSGPCVLLFLPFTPSVTICHYLSHLIIQPPHTVVCDVHRTTPTISPKMSKNTTNIQVPNTCEDRNFPPFSSQPSL